LSKLSKNELTSLKTLLDKLQATRWRNETIEKELKAEKEKLRKIEEEDIPSLFNEFGLSELKLLSEDGGLGDTISIKNVYRGHVSEKNKPEAFKWLRVNNHDDLIKNEIKINFGKGDDEQASNLKTKLVSDGISFIDKETVHPQSLSAFIREQTEAGKALPHDLLGVHIIQKAQIKKS